ncbi:low temperature-induced protein [Trichocoleus sp. FACHB-591]|uniref:low temperature-induced protein n=1 Tax=Trichocoleus TaxID=450526 RepID=UPI0016826191|nr:MULTISPECIES: low temperature-induced protein [unclassified Trichocoleus]MBD2098641.1 low temperature-induced protein [Trichocoleus sp. FACHB-591]MBD2122918.1 low temperature-induced protein [Trichocoleus sp. FACHB-262]
MQSIRINLSALLRPVRFLVIAFTCALLLVTQAAPAFAASSMYSGSSSPTKGEAQLKGIEEKSYQAIEANDPYGIEKEEVETQGKGLNAAQGDADIDKMYRPSNSQDAAPSVEQTIKKNLEKLQGK